MLDWSKLKAFADDKIELAKFMIFLYGRVEDMVSQHFSFSFNVFKKLLFQGRQKSGLAKS